MDWYIAAVTFPTTTTPYPDPPVTSGSTYQATQTTTTAKSEELNFSEFDPHYEFVSNIDFSEFDSEPATSSSVPTIVHDYDMGLTQAVDVVSGGYGSGMGLEETTRHIEETSFAPSFSTTTEFPELTTEHVRNLYLPPRVPYF